MSKRPIKLYLSDIQTAIKKIEIYTKGLTYTRFRRDEKTIDAVTRNIEIIGEAAKHIPREIRLNHVEVPWKQIIGTRSKVTHEYFGVDVEILWKTVTEDIPTLKNQIGRIVAGR